MLSWKLWDGTEEAWDQNLCNALDYTVFQSFSWGEYKKRQKWLPLRYISFDNNGKTIGMAQLLVKKLPLRMTFIWAPGGPVFCWPNNNIFDLNELIGDLLTQLRCIYPISVIRFHSQTANNSNLSYNFNKACLRPYFKLNSGYSVMIKLDQSLDQLKSKMTAKHRYYVKKSTDAGLCWLVGNNDKQLEDLAGIHQEMVHEKQLASIAISYKELINMRDVFGSQVLILTGYLDKLAVTSCLVLLFGGKAIYMIASTGKQGRKISAAYAMLERLILELTERGVTEFDFGGIDPVNPNAIGVNHFKCGFGGQIVEQLGEWEAANTEFIRFIINIAIRFRGGRL